MSNYRIFTDSGCDITPEMLEEWGVTALDLTFRFNGDVKEYSNREMDVKAFYERMRRKGVAKTAAVNPDRFAEAFEKVLAEGEDILYVGFSSGLSTTFNSARIAAEGLKEKYPERKIITVDTLAASAGQGLILYLTKLKKDEGASIEETAAYTEDIKMKISIWFTVEDLVYLKRGGRISAVTALVGNMLGIKPVLKMDEEGHLISVGKARGRVGSLAALADKYTELAADTKENTVFISHGDSLDDANKLAKMIEEKHGVKPAVITNVGTVIGAHSGPGTIALFFIGKER